VLNRRPNRVLSAEEQRILDLLQGGPQPIARMVRALRYGRLVLRQIERLEAERLLLRSGFTPTDALHSLGRFQRWNGQASSLGAEMLAAQLGLEVDAFCQEVVDGVPDRVTTELVSKVLCDEGAAPDWSNGTTAGALLDRVLGKVPHTDLRCQFQLERPVVAIGAPVEAYFPRVGEQLSTEIVIPPHAEVANAVGAVVGGVMQQVRVLIHPLETDSIVRVHLPDGIVDLPCLTDAVAHAQQVVPPYLERLAAQAGGTQVEISMTRDDRTAPVRGGWGSEVFLESLLTFTAVGRPSLA
jgi:N-methylhydantoinase A/oxoprolinase/acetone carboxylase beta subunit